MTGQVRVAGRWLDSHGGTPDLKWSLDENGSEVCTWSGTRLPWMKVRDQVLVFDGANPVWGGQLDAPGGDLVTASGYFKLLAEDPAANSSDNLTTALTGSINGAIARGMPLNIIGTLSSDQMIDDLEDGIPTVGDVVEAFESQRWADTPTMVWIGPRGGVSLRHAGADGFDPNRSPDSPARWMLRLPKRVELTPDLTNYASRLLVRYKPTGGSPKFDTVLAQANDLAATEARWGRRILPFDVTEAGTMSSARAVLMGRGALRRSMARPGFAEALEVHSGDLTTVRGTPVSLSHMLPGDTIRVMGEWDSVTALTGRNYADVRIARVEHSAGVARVEPVGLREGRRIEDLAAAAVRSEKRRRRKRKNR